MARRSIYDKDYNRYKKTYPFIRRKPFLLTSPDDRLVHQIGEETVTNADEVTISFTQGTFTSAPFVTAIAYDSNTNSQANVNVYIISVSTTQVELGFSATFTGKVHYQAIQSQS